MPSRKVHPLSASGTKRSSPHRNCLIILSNWNRCLLWTHLACMSLLLQCLKLNWSHLMSEYCLPGSEWYTVVTAALHPEPAMGFLQPSYGCTGEVLYPWCSFHSCFEDVSPKAWFCRSRCSSCYVQAENMLPLFLTDPLSAPSPSAHQMTNTISVDLLINRSNKLSLKLLTSGRRNHPGVLKCIIKEPGLLYRLSCLPYLFQT